MKIVTYKFVLCGSCVNLFMVGMVLFISCIDLSSLFNCALCFQVGVNLISIIKHREHVS